MTKEQEAQQAQMIATIRERNNTGIYGSPICEECDDLLKIVDSQAQKIEELRSISGTSTTLMREATQKIKEQENELNKVRALAFQIISITSGIAK
jgi:hypothetical protein